MKFNNDKAEAQKMNEAYVNHFINALEVRAPFKSVFGIGKADPVKKRSIKLITNSGEDKNNIMANLRNLKDQAAFKGLSCIVL